MIKYTNYIYEGYEKQQTSIQLKSDFEKSAYDMPDTVKEFVETLKPSDKGDIRYDWINAMGAGETYGANSRGDYFPRQELMDHHHTFVDNPARVYVQHANKDPEIRLGDVLFSYFNPDTDRVELIQSIEKTRLDKHAPDWVRSQLHVGQPYATSMGTKVAYDECSKCGQKNKTVAEYCDHLKYAMNQWQDGVHIHAINIDPNFFDNSIVRRGADRVARQLAKVASSDIVIPSATILTDAEFIKTARKTYFFQDSVRPYINEYNLPSIASRVHAWDRGVLNKLGEYPLSDVLGICKLANIELLPTEYQYLVLQSIDQTDLADEYFDNQVRFRIPDVAPNQQVKLSYDITPLQDIYHTIPFKSLSPEFLIYNSLVTEKLAFDYEVTDTPLLNEIGSSYVNYLTTQEKTAFDLGTFLMGLFFSLPNIKDQIVLNQRNKDTIVENMSAIKKRVNRIPVLPGKYNPVYQDVFLKTASFFQNAMDSIKNTGYSIAGNARDVWDATKFTGRGLKNYGHIIVPGVVGGLAMLNSRGKAVEDMATGQAPSIIGQTAIDHPFISTVVAAGLTAYAGKKIKSGASKLNFMKKADDDLFDEYKDHLSKQSLEDMYNMIHKLPEDFIIKICF